MTRQAHKGKRIHQKAGLNRSILEVGFGIIGGFLEYKAAEAGGFYLESPTRELKPTQRCAKCWELTPKTLKDRVHICSNPNCQHVEDRDVNAAQVNITWARGQELTEKRGFKPPLSRGIIKKNCRISSSVLSRRSQSKIQNPKSKID